jgi:glycosyltransferase involved in cell wall biosynthesis
LKNLKPLKKISLVVMTLNEEENIERCLACAEGVGEIIVVDSYSTDRTVEMAEAMGAHVYRRDFVSAADQKNWAMERSSLDWILIVDADEFISGELRREISEVVDNPDADGYWIRRRNEFFGRRIRFCGWQGDKVLRLFRRGKGRYRERAVHEKLILDGRARTLSSYLDHKPYSDMADYIERMKSYSGRGASELLKENRKWFPAVITHPIARFVRMYILQLGFLDGAAGLLLCTMAAASVFFKYAALRELNRRRPEASDGDSG